MTFFARILLSVGLTGFFLVAHAEGAAPAKADPAKGSAIYNGVCVSCHGADGNSSIPSNPKLAQQHPEYLAKQLAEFKSGKRANAVMMGFASALSEDDMRNVGAYLGSNKAKPGFAKDKESKVILATLRQMNRNQFHFINLFKVNVEMTMYKVEMVKISLGLIHV